MVGNFQLGLGLVGDVMVPQSARINYALKHNSSISCPESRSARIILEQKPMFHLESPVNFHKTQLMGKQGRCKAIRD